MEDGTTGSDSVSIPIDGEISEGLEAHKLYMPARVVDVEIIAAAGKFFPE